MAEMNSRRWASPADTAVYQGGVAVKTVLRQIARGDLTGYRLGRLVRVDLDEVDAMLERGAGSRHDAA